MKINIVVPFVELTGGIKIAFTYANELKSRGHDVVIYYPFIPYAMTYTGVKYAEKFLKTMARGVLKGGWRTDWYDLKVPCVMVPCIKSCFIRDADVCIATAWPTAYDVAGLSPKKGRKIYFVQHYEIWSGAPDKVDGSYRLPLKKIVIAQWLKDLMREKFGDDTSEIVYNGLDFNEFYPERRENIGADKDAVNVLMLAHAADIKGMNDGLEAIERLRKKYKNIRLKMFGTGYLDNIPKDAEFHCNPPRDELRRLYSDSDIYVFPSWSEGWGLTVVEAMACSCAVVGTNVGCLLDIGIDGKTAMLSNPRDIDALSSNIEKLVNDSVLRREIAKGGYEVVKVLEWKNSFDNFERILMQESERHI